MLSEPKLYSSGDLLSFSRVMPTYPLSFAPVESLPMSCTKITRRMEDLSMEEAQVPPGRKLQTEFSDLPMEIHEAVLDHLFGMRASISCRGITNSKASGSWSNMFRHPRRKELSNLALVCSTWRELIQERLYRHIKVKGTTSELHSCQEWFSRKLHLSQHVRHIEVWIPVWEKKVGVAVDTTGLYYHNENTTHWGQRTIIQTVVNATTTSFEETNSINSVYQLSSQNASLEEIFQFVKTVFSHACILTLEGGHCKKPPMIQHFRKAENMRPHEERLPVLDSIRTLVLKGAWNIMRDEEDLGRLVESIPNLREWHCTYAKPKSCGYLTIARALPSLPRNITHLSLSLEGFYSKEASSPRMWRKIFPETHICLELAKVSPYLQSLTYTGRICDTFFRHGCRVIGEQKLDCKLEAMDLVVKNCCRSQSVWNDGTGISNFEFIRSFEKLVTAGVASLKRMSKLDYLRIRFIDLDSPQPLLNPYFQLENKFCTGFWNEEIDSFLPQVRPGIRYLQLHDEVGSAGPDKEGRFSESGGPQKRPLCIKASNYAALADMTQH